jgi:hypothetical protein
VLIKRLTLEPLAVVSLAPGSLPCNLNTSNPSESISNIVNPPTGVNLTCSRHEEKEGPLPTRSLGLSSVNRALLVAFVLPPYDYEIRLFLLTFKALAM